MQIVITQKMSFGRPSIGPKHYLSAGASGWIETFLRTDADKALDLFVGRVDVEDLISNFLDHMHNEVERKKIHWPDVTSYLSRITRVHPDKIPVEVGVAFWARVAMREDEGTGN